MPKTVAETVQNIMFLTHDLHRINSDYNSLTASQFVNKYGGNAMDYVKKGLEETIQWGEQSYQNLANQPLQTIAAAISAGALYGAGRAVRFWKEKSPAAEE